MIIETIYEAKEDIQEGLKKLYSINRKIDKNNMPSLHSTEEKLERIISDLEHELKYYL